MKCAGAYVKPRCVANQANAVMQTIRLLFIHALPSSVEDLSYRGKEGGQD